MRQGFWQVYVQYLPLSFLRAFRTDFNCRYGKARVGTVPGAVATGRH